MKIQSMIRNSSLAVLALALVMGPSVGFAQNADSEQVSNLLSQARRQSMQADKDAAMLESYTRAHSSWQSHANQLQRIKEDVNKLGELNKQLGDSRAEGSPWQKTAIDQVDTRLREIADLLTVTINHLNDNPSAVHLQPYKDYVKAHAQMTSRLAKMIDDFVDYDEAKSKADSLEQKLELPVVASGT